MPLVKNNNAAAGNSKFEETGDTVIDNDTGAVVGEGAAEAGKLSADERVAAQLARNAEKAKEQVKEPEPAAASTAAPASTSTAVAPKAPSAVANKIMDHDPFKACENALRVDYNTLTQIMVTNGNVALKEGKELMGDHVGLEILSFQAQWVMSPGGDSNDEEALEYLKYSDDGIHVRGSDQTLTEAKALAIAAGYDKASINERMILVGALVYPGKDKKGNLIEELQDELVQIDLAPRSKNNFTAYRANAAFKVSRGLLQPDAALRVCMTAAVKSKGNFNWTDAEFKALTDADMK